MRFKFDANQEFQVNAIEAVAQLFEGQARDEGGFSLRMGPSALSAVGNSLDLDDNTLLANLQSVQRENGIPLDEELCCIEETVDTADGPKLVRFPNFSVEMETGTGKTYVYIRTALELYRRYGFRKYIIVVPSIAIREGVLKTLRITETHLHEIYSNPPYRYHAYDSANLSQVRQFALSSGIEMMIMTIDSFNKASNVIWQTTDRLQGETPMHLVQATRPVLILDEPQNMESELRVRALSALDPIFALRYSATHRNPYNVIYRLSPFEAYRQGLVKRIEVASVMRELDVTQAFLRLDGIKAAKRTITARIALHKLMKDGTIKEQVVTVGQGDSLAEKANRPEYDGLELREIDAASGVVSFANGLKLGLGESSGADRQAVFDEQIRYTIEEHFRKQAKLRSSGIKVLSLFFIDRVANYAPRDSLLRGLFSAAFNELKGAYPDWTSSDPEKVQASYFAKQRRRGGGKEDKDSSTGRSQADQEAYELIMKEKERLLSFDEPVAFVFSHSALREGWDNPNIFQICTLNQTASELKKRQEVGRGVRLAVEQSGERVHDEKTNVLTVVANESYEHYVSQLQTEIEEEYGAEGLPPKPVNARRRAVSKLRKRYTHKPEFKELWERIKHKTRYAVRIDSDSLLDDVVRELDNAEIRPPQITVTKVQVDAEDDRLDWRISGAKTVLDVAGRFPLPNIVDIMAHLMEHTTPPMRLTRRTLLEVFNRTRNKRAGMNNPQEFATVAVRIIKDKLADHLINGIRYEKIDEWYEMTRLEAEVESWEDYLVPADHSVYSQVFCESGVERRFVEGLERRQDVKMYLKLPGWFKVATPIGEYNPDWAIVLEERDEHGNVTDKPLLYLVRETKDRGWETDLRPEERRKIKCGAQHFREALDVDYKVVTKASELL